MREAPETRTELVGRTIAERFEVLAFARGGGMGHVYRARDTLSGATVALKVLAQNTGDVGRFAREATVLASLEHPGIVRYVDSGVLERGAPYLAMEWLEGEDLGDRLGSSGTLSVVDTLLMARKIVAALAAAHRAGIIHRDLKAGNVLLVGGHIDAPKLVDFGIARAVASSDLTTTGAVVGTPAYMAPEQVRGEGVGPPADVYGVGGLIFRCLAGRAPFEGSHPLAVLAKVIVEPVTALRDLRADVPPGLAELVDRLLAKDPRERPADARALEAELAAISEERSAGSERRIPAAISAREQRIACVVLCASGATAEEVTLAEDAAARSQTAIEGAILTRGGVLARIGGGACVVTIPHAATAADQAARAARCALALAEVRAGTPVFIATGRVIVTGEGRVGEVIDRAAAALVVARKEGAGGGVRVDRATAELLAGRFRLRDGSGEWSLLLGEDEDAAPVRTLLGRPAACVGREPQLATLEALLATSADESRAGVALVVGEPGLGKTHLIGEVRARARARAEREGATFDVLVGQADPLRAGSPSALAGQLIARAAGLREADPPDVAEGKILALAARDAGAEDGPALAELLGEMAGIRTPAERASAALRAARADASVMAAALRDGWSSWSDARVARGPLLVVLEDVQWADAVSLGLLAAATATAADRPLFVVATARPEGKAAFAERFCAHGIVELTLGPLSTAASSLIVSRALGSNVDPEAARSLCRRAGGHPFFLEELIRAYADGRGEGALPDTVLGIMQARLDGLAATARQVLRAASVFGDGWKKAGVLALLGDETTDPELRRALAELTAKEMVIEERGSKAAGDSRYRFRHMLLRDAAYATLADVDRVRAHERAAEWLEGSGESDPAVLGEHFARGGIGQRAAALFSAAAAQALGRSDFDRAQAHAARARELGPDADTDAALHGIEAEILYWRGEIAVAAERAPSAVVRLARGSREWLDAVSVAVGALGQLGRNDEVTALLRDAARTPTPATCREAHIVALCRGLTQLFWAHARAELADVRASLDALVAAGGPLDPYAAGWVHRVAGESAFLHRRELSRSVADLEASAVDFERARAARPLCLARLNAASLVGFAGDPARGLALVAAAASDADKLGAGFLLRYGGAVEGLLLAYARDPSAEAAMEAALAGVAGSPRLAFICRVVLASLALDRGDAARARAQAEAARAIDVVDDLRPAGLALASRAALLGGDVPGALGLAEEAFAAASSAVDLELTFGLPELALAEAHLARGDRAAAARALAPTAREVLALAKTIDVPEQRARFLARPIANDRVVALAGELGLAHG